MTKDSCVAFLQELAFSSFKRMASVLKRESNDSVGFTVVRSTVGSVLSGIANVLQSSASLARVDATDSKENITGYTGYTGNSTEGGVVSVKERVSNQILFHCFILFILHLPFPWFPFSAQPQYYPVGQIQDFRVGVSRYISPNGVPCRGSGGIHPRKIFKTEILGNGISDILMPSHRVITSNFFNLGGSAEFPPNPQPPPPSHSRSAPTAMTWVCSVDFTKEVSIEDVPARLRQFTREKNIYI